MPEGMPHPAGMVDAAELSLAWGLPFVGMLLSIALLPLLAGRLWHHHYGKIAAGWALLLVLPFAAVFGPEAAAAEVWHVLLQEYIPFIALLLALYTTGGGVLVRGRLRRHAGGQHRAAGGRHGARQPHGHHRRVDGADPPAAAGQCPPDAARRIPSSSSSPWWPISVGSLTPLGDPPLYLGFLKGCRSSGPPHICSATPFCAVLLLGICWLLDSWTVARMAGRRSARRDRAEQPRL